jgi:hypothetical protein
MFNVEGSRPISELILTYLSEGFQSFMSRDDSAPDHLDGLLDTLQVHEEQLLARLQDGDGKTKPEDVVTKADVITYRGMMTKVDLLEGVEVTTAHDNDIVSHCAV